MKLVYLTSHQYPSRNVNLFICESMANAFSEISGNDFLFVVRGVVPESFKRINTYSFNFPRYLKAFFYFLFLPTFVIKQKLNKQKVVFFSADPYLLAILVFWRKVFGLKYRICSEWHQLFDDWRDRYVAKNSDYLVSTSKR